MVNNYYKIDHKSEDVYSIQLSFYAPNCRQSIRMKVMNACRHTFWLVLYIITTVLFIYMASYSVDFTHPNPPQTIN